MCVCVCVWLISHGPWTSAHQSARAHDWAIEEMKKNEKQLKKTQRIRRHERMTGQLLGKKIGDKRERDGVLRPAIRPPRANTHSCVRWPRCTIELSEPNYHGSPLSLALSLYYDTHTHTVTHTGLVLKGASRRSGSKRQFAPSKRLFAPSGRHR